tara:strand:- start:293 stop:1141 length:849 start_codon:yes stop_codon:yes gene_type:complete
MPIFQFSFLLCFIFFIPQSFALTGEKIADVLISNGASVEYQNRKAYGSHQIVLSAPKRINNQIVIEKNRRIDGELNVILLHLSPAFSPSESFRKVELFLAENGRLQFQCQQRACGVSSNWANDVFDEKRLTGRDSDQYYIAGNVQLPDAQYLVTIYFVTNALRQNLAYITYIKQSPETDVWVNGYLLNSDLLLPEDVRISLKKRLENNSALNLFLAAYVDSNKFNTLPKMENAVKVPFIIAQKKLAELLSINASKVRMQFVGAFHSQIPVDGAQVWFRLFLY